MVMLLSPMGTIRALLVADLFLFCYETCCVLVTIVEAFYSTSRYRRLIIGNPYFDQKVG